MSAEFVPAIELSEGFYRDVVEPIVRPFPHAAALIGYGSELLGFDTERSTDHGWGPRLQVFVDARDISKARAAVEDALPDDYRGWPVRFGWDDVPVQHHVYVGHLDPWLSQWLGCNPFVQMTLLDWMAVPQQRLLGFTRGAVYHDASGALTELREQLHYFPEPLVPWILACQWRRVWQREPLVGRAAEVGDDAGSRLVTAALLRDLMRVHFVLTREYWPYDKWFGSAYRRLPGSETVRPHIDAALDASDFTTREKALVGVHESIAALHNASGTTDPVDPTVRPFYSRPYRVLDADRLVRACLARVDDPWLRALPLSGSIDQCVDSVDVLEHADVASVMRALYGEPE